MLNDLIELFLGHGAFKHLAEAHADADEIALLAIEPAGLHIAAGNDDRRDVQTGSRHKKAGDDLVAGADQNHAVHLVAFDQQFDLVGQQIAARQNIGTFRDGVAYGYAVELEAHAAGVMNALFHLPADLTQVHMAGIHLAVCVDDRNTRTAEILVGIPAGTQQRQRRIVFLAHPVSHAASWKFLFVTHDSYTFQYGLLLR